METIVIYSYFIIGAIFLGYFYLTFLQRKINNVYRFGISLLFLALGFFFMSTAGEILLGEKEVLETVSLLLAFVALGMASFFMYNIRELSKSKR